MDDIDAYDVIEKRLKKQEKKDRKAKRKDRKAKKKEVRFEADLKEGMEQGIIVCDDDIDKDRMTYKEEEYLLKKPVW